MSPIPESITGLNETQYTAVVETILADFSAYEFVPSADFTAIWGIICGILVFFMHAGFSMLEAGTVRTKNAVNIMFKNILTVSIGAISYYALGYGFAYGSDAPFIGSGSFFLNSGDGGPMADADKWFWFFQFAFAATAATIVSGSMAGRVNLLGYAVIAFFLTVFVYPVVSHWIWATGGWLSAFSDPADRIFYSSNNETCGMIDYAGSGVVHMTGGISAMVFAAVLGPRIGRFVDGKVQPMLSHNVALTTLGTIILWVGWYGFNCGSTLAVDGTNASHVAVTTTLAPAAAAATGMLVARLMSGTWDLSNTLNCILAGLVSITAGCSTISGGLSLVVGAIGAIVYMGSSKLLLKLGVDDPLDAASVHGSVGIWGVLAVGIFGDPVLIAQAYNCPSADMGSQFVVQLIGVAAIVGWCVLWALLVALPLKAAGLLRVSAEIEEAGLDVSEHGAKAFDLTYSDKVAGGSMVDALG